MLDSTCSASTVQLLARTAERGVSLVLLLAVAQLERKTATPSLAEVFPLTQLDFVLLHLHALHTIKRKESAVVDEATSSRSRPSRRSPRFPLTLLDLLVRSIERTMPRGGAKPAQLAATDYDPSPSLSPPPPAPSPRSPSLALTLTIRHLPSDRWQSFSVPREWRVEQVKAAALASFANPVAAHAPAASVRRPAASSTSPSLVDGSTKASSSSSRSAMVTSGRSKENEEVAGLDSQAVWASHTGGGSSGGLRAAAKATSSMAIKVRSPLSLVWGSGSRT